MFPFCILFWGWWCCVRYDFIMLHCFRAYDGLQNAYQDIALVLSAAACSQCSKGFCTGRCVWFSKSSNSKFPAMYFDFHILQWIECDCLLAQLYEGNQNRYINLDAWKFGNLHLMLLRRCTALPYVQIKASSWRYEIQEMCHYCCPRVRYSYPLVPQAFRVSYQRWRNATQRSVGAPGQVPETIRPALRHICCFSAEISEG